MQLVADVDQSDEAEGGVCIVSTHFGKGFARGGQVNAETAGLLRYLADKSGWFVPVSDVLDRLLAAGRGRTLTAGEILRLELRFLADRLRRRTSGG